MGITYCLTFITVALRFTERGTKGGEVDRMVCERRELPDNFVFRSKISLHRNQNCL